MHLLILWRKGRERDCFGPFPTEERAREYREAALVAAEYLHTYEILPLIVPHLVKRIEWKEDVL